MAIYFDNPSYLSLIYMGFEFEGSWEIEVSRPTCVSYSVPILKKQHKLRKDREKSKTTPFPTKLTANFAISVLKCI